MEAQTAPGQMSGYRNKVVFGFVALLTTSCVTGAAAQSFAVGPADLYYRLLDRDCPAKHLAWLSDADVDLAIQDVRNSLEPAQTAQWDCLADPVTACSANAAGFRPGHTAAYIGWSGAVNVGILPRLVAKVCSMPVICFSKGNCSEQR